MSRQYEPNSMVYSCRDYWYLRGIAAPILLPREGQFRKGRFRFFRLERKDPMKPGGGIAVNTEDESLRPIASAYYAAGRQAYFVDEANPSEVIGIEIKTGRNEQRRTFPQSYITAMCTYGGSLFLLDAAAPRIIRVRLNMSMDKLHEAPIERIKMVGGPRPTKKRSRFVLWEEELQNDVVLRGLMWNVGARSVWSLIGDFRELQMSRTSLGLSGVAFNNLQVYDAVADRESSNVFLTDQGNGRIYKIPFQGEPRAGLLAGDQKGSLEVGAVDHAKFNEPRGITIFQLRPEMEKRVREVFPGVEDWQRVMSNRFLVVVHGASNGTTNVVTISLNGPSNSLKHGVDEGCLALELRANNAMVLPLLLPAEHLLAEKHPGNLLWHDLGDDWENLTEVYAGPDGTLLFGRPLGSKWGILDPHIGEVPESINEIRALSKDSNWLSV